MKPLFRLPGQVRGEIVARFDLPIGPGIWLRRLIIYKDSAGSLRVAVPDAISSLEFESEEIRRAWEDRILEEYRIWSAAPTAAIEEAPAGRYSAWFDGGSRGNPGPSACAAFVRPPAGAPIERSRFLGQTTNNVAEYSGVILALETIRDLAPHQPATEVLIHGDSQLAVRQLSGDWKIKDPKLADLAEQVHELVDQLGVPVRFRHVAREQNAKADALVNRCLDGFHEEADEG